MSDVTGIQWCDSTVNPIMGCGGCELFPAPGAILNGIDSRLGSCAAWQPGTARRMFEELIAETWNGSFGDGPFAPGLGHSNDLTTTNIYHLRKEFQARVTALHGKQVGILARDAIEQGVTCYAAKLHLNKGYSIENPARKVNKGYAPTFEQVTPFEGRLTGAARLGDLLGTDRLATRKIPAKPWLNGLPRLIFVSDMGDAFSRKTDFSFLRREIEAINGTMGSRHLWLWLTKRPKLMAGFARQLGGFPPNICAMTTVTSANTVGRIDELRQVDAKVRGLSIEPLRERIPSRKLNLSGIDWVIVGGESGKKKLATPFPVEWAEELQEHCRERDVAFFLKQLGSRPTRRGHEIKLKDSHGGEWDEWESTLRVREVPAYFRDYRAMSVEGGAERRAVTMSAAATASGCAR